MGVDLKKRLFHRTHQAEIKLMYLGCRVKIKERRPLADPSRDPTLPSLDTLQYWRTTHCTGSAFESLPMLMMQLI
jgi:hypothetical protein